MISSIRDAFVAVEPTATERDRPRPGDTLIPVTGAVMDRAFTVPGTPVQVWPWMQQLGKHRGGWYLPRGVERFLPPARRATRHIESRWQSLRVGAVIPDWGGAGASFEVAEISAPYTLIYTSRRGAVELSWAILLTEIAGGTRVHLRLRLGPLRRPWLATTVGDRLDLLTVAAMAAGLRERLADPGQVEDRSA